MVGQILGEINLPVSRAAIFVVYMWFGGLKVLGMSPVSPLVHRLFDATLGFIDFNAFYLWFAIFEVTIGFLFLFPQTTKLALGFLAVHLTMTAGPLVLLAGETWNGFLLPSMEGQYILKNFLILAVAVNIAADVFKQKDSSVGK